MKDEMGTTTKQRKHQLCMLFLLIIAFYHLATIPPILIYAPEKIDEQPLLTFLYNRIKPEHIRSIDLFIDNSPVLSILKHSEIARSIMLLLGCSIPFFMPMIFYKKNTITFYMTRMKTAKNVATQGNLLIAAVIISLMLSVIVNFIFSGREASSQFPPFNIEYIVFWIRYIFIVCFFGPYSEELLFRGVFLDEIKQCHASPRFIIFCQAAVFYGLHVLFSGNFAIQPFLIGIITGVFCLYTNSLLYGLVLHVCNNIIVVMLLTGAIHAGKSEGGGFVFLLSLLLLALAFLCLRLFIHQMKKAIIPSDCSS